MAVKLIDELQKEIKAAGEAVTQEAYENNGFIQRMVSEK